MTAALSLDAVERFRGLVARRFGLSFDDAKLGVLADVLRRRLAVVGQPCETYLGSLEARQLGDDELRALASALTVTETYFFRNPDQFRALEQSVLPSRIQAQATTRRLRILSAGCASGEEPYSLAIVARQCLPDPFWDVSIRGVDINPAMLDKARLGRYSVWSLRETPPEIQRRWWTQEDRVFHLDAALRDAVRFEERNLVEADPALWQPETFDVVFCRNVLMYFTPQQAQAVVVRIARALVRGGYLFLGHAETLRGISQDFHLRHTHGTFYYQRRPSLERECEAAFWDRAEAAAPLPPALVDGADTWVDAIRRATDRIQALSARAPTPVLRGDGAPPAGVERGWDLRRSIELLRNERFAEALALMHTLPPESAHDPEVLLLRATLLAHSGEPARAEAICAELLELDELNSGAHYLLALCREAAGDRRGAVAQDQVAVYLDPSFAMPRLHLGLLARRAGDADAARKEFGDALVLLQREDASRLLFFGGGFSREALTALCRAEIAACGGGG